VSWSKPLSHAYALIFKDWIRDLIQQVDPWVSSEDISKGQRWSSELFGELSTAGHGVICVVRENMAEPWLNFEAGALSKSLNGNRVYPVLIGISEADLVGPLTQFQATSASREKDMWQLVQSINEVCPAPLDEVRLTRYFAQRWPDLEAATAHLLAEAPGDAEPATVRPEGQILDEVLASVREIKRAIASLEQRQPGLPRPRSATAPTGQHVELAEAAHETEEALALLRQKLKGMEADDS
jgi:hypothetical protein